MPIQTDFNVAPYYDDYQDSKDFYKILFRPGVAVQARELNQLQTILQKQIERFGDNVFRRGTIIDGCYMVFHDVLPYIKIKDVQTDGAPVNVSQFQGLYIKNQANLQALVVTTLPGYESRNPDLNTLYIQYVNSGDSQNDTQYAADQVLTVFDPRESVAKVLVQDGAAGFSNTDTVVFTSAIAVTNSTGGTTFNSGGFTAGEVINNGQSANAVVVSVDTVTNNEVVILRIRPLANNLVTGNTTLWTFSANDSIINANNGQTANLSYIVGAGASATLATDSIGQIDFVAMTSGGSNYSVKPYVSVASKTANTAQTAQANLDPQTYVAQITVANSITVPVGSGYGMTVGDGIIYQKGYFSRVQKQLVVVEKYGNPSSQPDPLPDGKVVGFDTNEEVINSFIDDSLLDNAAGTFNAAAPGANRLKLTPTLVVLDRETAEANSDFFSIAEFTEGKPFKQNRQTVYNKIGDELARRTAAESGDYVLDQFLTTTKSDTNFANENANFTVVVDPGVAFIDGYEVRTFTDYAEDVDKGTDTFTSNNATISLNYGSYVRVNQLGGSFLYSVGALVSLYNTAVSYVSNTSKFGTAITPAGTKLGEARIRSLTLESGVAGTPGAVYRMYLFDIRMSSGANFKNVRSVYYDGTYDGIADIVTVTDPTTGGTEAVLYESNKSAMTFYAGVDAVANIENVSYIYRSIDTGRTANTAGIITKSVTDGTFPYVSGGTLNAGDKQDLIVVPLANVIAAANLTGNFIATSGSNTVTGVGTQFLTDLAAGDWIRVANTSLANTVRQVASIANNTYLTLTQPAGASLNGNGTLYFPRNVPVSLDRSSRVANVSANGSVLTIALGTNLANDTPVALAYNVRAANTPYVTKTVNRDVYVRLRLANNAARTTGPWCLGLSDVFRLKNVYLGSNNTFGPTDSGVVDITNDYYVDHNQNENYYNTSYLYRKQTALDTITSSSVLLVKVDAFTTTSEGLKTVLSYNVNDTVELANNTTEVNTVEIPEGFTTRGEYYDLRDHVDFRPVSNNTATVATSHSTASINPVEPAESVRFSAADKKFPAPDSDLTATITYYTPRTDLVCVTSNSDINVVRGVPGTFELPTAPENSLVLTPIIIPPYPSLPELLSSKMALIADTKIANEKYSNVRLRKYRIQLPVSIDERNRIQPRGYKMTDIADLERRIADLEYYVSFTLAEALVKNRTIPSDVTPNMERFKFGFFVDPFSDYTYADTSNPEFDATIINGKLQPPISEVNLEFQFNFANTDATESVSGVLGTLPWREHTLVQQLGATDGPVYTPPVVVDGNTFIPTPVANVVVTPTVNATANTTANTVVIQPPAPVANTGANTSVINVVTTTQITQSITNVIAQYKDTQTSKTGAVYEEFEYKMSSLPGPVRLYFNFRDNKNAIEIFYGNRAGFSTAGLTPTYNSLNAVALASTDSQYFTPTMGKLEALNAAILVAGKWAVEDAGKILWTHSPALGEYVKIRVTKYYKSGGADNWKGKYFFRIYYPTDSTTTTTTTLVSPDKFVYDGTIVGVTPDQFTIQTAYNYINGGPVGTIRVPFISDSQAFSITVSGLKPKTIHKFKFDGVDQSARCKPQGGSLGSSLVSTDTGVLSFQFFYDAGINEATSDYQQQNSLVNSKAGVKAFSIYSADETSLATGEITIKGYAAAIINTGTTTATTPAVSSGVTVPTTSATATATTPASTTPTKYYAPPADSYAGWLIQQATKVSFKI